MSQRKLLLNRKELKKLKKQITDVGLTIIPLKLFINDSGLAKMKIALAKGKKLYDKRQSLKEKELKRDIEISRKNKVYFPYHWHKFELTKFFFFKLAFINSSKSIHC